MLLGALNATEEVIWVTEDDLNIFPSFTHGMDASLEFHGYVLPTPDICHSYLWGRVVLDELKFFYEVFA
jgi:hypothetical protein